LIQPIYLQVLRKIHNGLAGSSAVWAVTGSLGMALQGMPVTVNDIDIQTDRSGAYEIERRFAPFVTRKVTFSEAETIRSHFGSLTIDGIRVEIMGDIQKAAGGRELGRARRSGPLSPVCGKERNAHPGPLPGV